MYTAPPVTKKERQVVVIATSNDDPTKSAEAIVAYRQQNGDFKSLDDVEKVPNVDTKFLDSIKDSLVYQ